MSVCKNCQSLKIPGMPCGVCGAAEAKSSFAAPSGSATVLDEYVRLDKTIRDCEHSLMIAERLKARGHNLPESEVDAVRLKLSEAMIERDFMDEWMRRRAESPNDRDQLSRTPNR